MINNLLASYFSHFKNMPKHVILILLSIFIYFLGYVSVIFLPLYLHHSLNYSLKLTGIMLSLFGLGSILSSLYSGKLSDIFSPYLVSTASTSLYSLTLILTYFTTGPRWLVAILLFLLGIGCAAFSPSSRIFLMKDIPLQDQSRINGIRYILLNAGTALSFGISGWIIQEDYRRIFIIGLICCIATTFILLPLKQKDEKTTLSRKIKPSTFFFKDRFLLLTLISFFAGMLVFAQINSSYSLFLSKHYHLFSRQIASLFLINSLLIIVFQLPLISLQKSISQPLVMAIGCFIMGLGFFILPFGQSYLVAIASILIITVGEMLFIPTAQSIIYQHAKPNLKGFYMGVYQALYSVTLMLTPLLSGFALTYNRSGVLLWSASLILCSTPMFIFILFTKNT